MTELITYYSLPFEIILLIAQDSPNVWCRLVKADKRLAKYQENPTMVAVIQDKFTTTSYYHDINQITISRLPLGQRHRNWDKPAVLVIPYNVDEILKNIYSTIKHTITTQYWYQYDKKHREGDKPAEIMCYLSYGSIVIHLCWWKNGKRHRDGGLPATEHITLPKESVNITLANDMSYESDSSAIKWEYNGQIYQINYNPESIKIQEFGWWVNGRKHRDDDLPAVIKGCRSEWWVNGKRHRNGGLPAVLEYCGNEWWVNGKLHRDGDQPAVVFGVINHWYKHGKSHRDGDKPAYISDGLYQWFRYGKLHRRGDNPASVIVGCRVDYWLNGINIYSKEL
jgi:hypothetical protein